MTHGQHRHAQVADDLTLLLDLVAQAGLFSGPRLDVGESLPQGCGALAYLDLQPVSGCDQGVVQFFELLHCPGNLLVILPDGKEQERNAYRHTHQEQ